MRASHLGLCFATRIQLGGESLGALSRRRAARDERIIQALSRKSSAAPRVLQVFDAHQNVFNINDKHAQQANNLKFASKRQDFDLILSRKTFFVVN
jgi:hypothetical protein